MPTNNPQAVPPYMQLHAKIKDLNDQFRLVRRTGRGVVCQVARTVNVVVSSGIESTLAYNVAISDPEGMWNGAANVRIPWGGWWQVTLQGQWAGNGNGVRRVARVYKTSIGLPNIIVAAEHGPDSGATFLLQNASAPYMFNGGEVLFTAVYQDTGGSLAWAYQAQSPPVPALGSMTVAFLGG